MRLIQERILAVSRDVLNTSQPRYGISEFRVCMEESVLYSGESLRGDGSQRHSTVEIISMGEH